MVNTRRSESIGTTPDINNQHRTRRRVPVEVDCEDNSDSEDTQPDDSSWDGRGKPKLIPQNDVPLSSKVRELRNRFVYSERKYSSRLKSDNLNTRKRISLNEKHSLTVYSRNMHDDLDLDMMFDEGSDEEVYSRSRRPRHLRARMARRTALSLRPIAQKCYTDSHSPLFDSNCGEIGVRRSKRQRKSQVENMSWLTDDQMHKVGYPNLNSAAGYSEEDSRDAQEETLNETSRRITRHSNDLNNKRREVKNPKYLFDYDTNVSSKPRRRTSETNLLERSKTELKNRRESNDKENKEDTNNVNGRPHTRSKKDGKECKSKNDDDDDEDDEDEDDENSEDENLKSEIKENGIKKKNDAEEEEEEEEVEKPVEENKGSSESDELPRLRTRNRRNNLLINQNFRNCRTRSRKPIEESGSSDSEEDVRKRYSLRNRKPQPAPNSMMAHELAARSRRHFNRRRKVPSSSSGSSSDSDVYCNKNNKNTHLKNEQKMKSGAGGSKIIPIGPETLDTKVRFSSIGGLDGHIQCLKEMILLPMMYPEVFRQFQIQPPRGVLFHGPPGTGKTLIARALANECSFGCRKVSFFMRKGADLLSKWIGESEKQLRLLFEQAAEKHPSIIFFDELDGLAPVRSSRQDQVHASIVSTLLALMDGLDNRGEVIVIGATNRIDAIDPALRRPGRFDRELYFPLPAKKEREEILKVHVSQWACPPSEQLLSYLAEQSVGYCGSDLRALCSEAVIQSFRRTYPQVYNSDYRLLLNSENVKVEKIDFLRAKSLLIPASHRVTQGLGRKLMPILEPLLKESIEGVFGLLKITFPHAVNPALAKVKLSINLKPAHLLVIGENNECGQTTHLAPAMLYRMEHINTYILDLVSLYRDTGRAPEEACIQVFNEARRNVPSVIYIPNIDHWWSLVSDAVKVILDNQMSNMDPNIPILLLSTASTKYDILPAEIQSLFSRYRKEVYELENPNDASRDAFFRPLIIDSSLKPPRKRRERPKTPPPLPRAPTPPPTPLTEEQSKKLYEQEEHTLRELRIFLRDMCKKLANNKLFYMFTKPVDTDTVPDYTTIIKQPMDLETMMTKVDFHRYECAKDFLDDIELICQNALEYNPARTSADKQIRHRACSLRDYAYTLIKKEMDSDFEDLCQDIAKKRIARKTNVQKYLPPYIQTPDDSKLLTNKETENTTNNAAQSDVGKSTTENKTDDKEIKDENDKESQKDDKNDNNTSNNNQRLSKKRKLSWQKGFIRKKKIKKIIDDEKNSSADEHNSPADNLNMEVTNNSSMDENNVTNVSANVDGDENLAADVSTELSINCDTSPAKSKSSRSRSASLQSPRRRLSDLMSPSELLDFPLEFDDIDQALNEETTDNGDNVNTKTVECNKEELEEVLQQAVKATYGVSLQILLDLYNQLSSIIKKYSDTPQRTNLPKDLSNELTRFINEHGAENVSSSQGTPKSNLSQTI